MSWMNTDFRSTKRPSFKSSHRRITKIVEDIREGINNEPLLPEFLTKKTFATANAKRRFMKRQARKLRKRKQQHRRKEKRCPRGKYAR